MLSFDSPSGPPGPEDVVFVFAGQDCIGDLMASPGSPWRWNEVVRVFGERDVVPVGYWQQQPAFAVDLEPEKVDPLRHIPSSLYSLLGRIDDALFSAQGRAFQLLKWQRDHQFCGRCGSKTELGDSGRGLACARCELMQYPRLAPCVIFLIQRGEQILLAQANHRRATFYSTLAGFVEPGESAEQAIEREAYEEVGVQVSDIQYFRSQAWPFPGQLMLGFFAQYAGGELRPDGDEILEAGWFDAHNLPPLPPMTSISGQLISHGLVNDQA
ncbi:NADH pyrophosphatase [Luminiphilus syltensis NOR5-1B]|uniref:NAD(+) diphosphatase n=1 Tax=Luminiphilus syltensis NOR5-1B TaxID=565045 RepID=B8KSC4_9GAMM|nr:NAD(+) diphosphatase [Luminiphilus syltensis]EED36089.1 NADH pyrophosphatase [Luminiphilus syltensis NOR5-1B]